MINEIILAEKEKLKKEYEYISNIIESPMNVDITEVPAIGNDSAI